MVIDAGGGYTFWQLRVQYEKPSFTNSQTGAAGGTGSNGSDADNDTKAGQQSEEMPQLVGGGLGVPGSKARVLSILRDVGYEEVIPVVEVSQGQRKAVGIWYFHLSYCASA
jgi:hypothetical protein